jgi:hypothetical protein
MMKKILSILGIFIAALVVMSSGAFTSVTADRTATVNVVGDPSALLGLNAGSSSLVRMVDGELTIDLGNVTASGVNMDAVTVVDNAFTVTNNGNNEVTVTLTDNASSVVFSSDLGDIEAGITLGSGASATVSFTVDTTGMSSGDVVLDGITIEAKV